MNNKYKVNRAFLLIAAAVLWLVAGVNVFIVGVKTWIEVTHVSTISKILYASIVLLIFLFIIFKPIHKKYVERILNLPEKNHPLAVFDIKGWGIMFFMIGFGYCVRKFSLFPDSFIATFYTGLSIALTYTGILFINSWRKFTS